jgi:hypothetical protein
VLLFLLRCLFLGCHGSILPSIFHGRLCNDLMLRLIECIESIKSDVKKKMALTSASDPCTKVTAAKCERNFSIRKMFRVNIFEDFHDEYCAADSSICCSNPEALSQDCGARRGGYAAPFLAREL